MTLMQDAELLRKLHDDAETTQAFQDLAEFAAENIGIKRGQHGEEEWWMDGFNTGAAYISETNTALIALALAADELNHIFKHAGQGDNYPLEITTRDPEFAEYFSRVINGFSEAVANTQTILEQIRTRKGEPT